MMRNDDVDDDDKKKVPSNDWLNKYVRASKSQLNTFLLNINHFIKWFLISNFLPMIVDLNLSSYQYLFNKDLITNKKSICCGLVI